MGCKPAFTDEEDAGEDECQRGTTVRCTGTDGCRGKRACEGSPARLEACICDAEPAAPDAAQKAELGAPCTRDRDCPQQAFCLQPAADQLFGGGPPHGVCVADCSGGEARCAEFANARCVGVAPEPLASGGPALCFESCQLGRASEPKCHDAPHVACAPLESDDSAAFCRPLCTRDEECASGACDPAHGVCVASAVLDPSFGQRCDPEAAPEPVADASAEPSPDAGAEPADAAVSDELASCAGACVQLNGAPSVCSRRCVFGTTDECAPASGGLRRGGCIFASRQGGIGDLGYCAELCDCSDDCIDASFVCDAFDDNDLESAFGRKGVCTDPALVTAHVLSCAD